MPHARDASPLEAHLGFWLRFVSNHVSAAFARKLDAKGVSVGEWVAMRELLDAAERAPSEVAERTGMTRGAITKLVDKLAAKGLVERRTGGADRRFQALALTPKGRALVPVLAALADKNDEEFFSHLTKAERARLAATMQGIVRRRVLRGVPIN